MLLVMDDQQAAKADVAMAIGEQTFRHCPLPDREKIC
jgi:hypothetical protein